MSFFSKTRYSLLALLAALGTLFSLSYYLATSLVFSWKSFFSICSMVEPTVLNFVLNYFNFWKIGVLTVFIFGLLNGLIYLFLQPLRHRQIFNKLQVAKKFNGNELIKLVDDRRVFAFTAGYLNPQIYISSAMAKFLSAEELSAICDHEQYHLERRHPVQLLIIGFIGRILFFMPIIFALKKFITMRFEIAADRYAVSRNSREAVASAMYKFFDSNGKFEFSGAAVAGFAASAERIDYLMSGVAPKLSVSKFNIIASFFSLFLLWQAMLVSPALAQETEISQLNADDYSQLCQSSKDSLKVLMSFGYYEPQMSIAPTQSVAGE